MTSRRQQDDVLDLPAREIRIRIQTNSEQRVGRTKNTQCWQDQNVPVRAHSLSDRTSPTTQLTSAVLVPAVCEPETASTVKHGLAHPLQQRNGLLELVGLDTYLFEGFAKVFQKLIEVRVV
jgi:hypothetical protein